MKEIMRITNCLCQALKKQSQDILNVMQLFCSTKISIQKLRDDGWQILLKGVILFCEQHNIDMLDFNSIYVARHSCSQHQNDHVIVEHRFQSEYIICYIEKSVTRIK